MNDLKKEVFSNETLKKKARKRVAIIFLSFFLLFIGFDAYNYFKISPLLRISKIETLKHPYADRIDVSDVFKKHIPIGSDQKFVLRLFQNSGFNVDIVDVKKLPPNDPRHLKKDHSYYWGREEMPAGLIKTSLLFAEYEVQVSLDFSKESLSNMTVFIFLNTL